VIDVGNGNYRIWTSLIDARMINQGEMIRSENRESEDIETQRQKWRKMAYIAALTACMVVSTLGIDKEGYHTSALTGEDWVRELLFGHPE
jgi:hypothetical protein